MANLSGFNISKKSSRKWGTGGRVGGGTKYDQIEKQNGFTVHPESGLNRRKPNVVTDKPYDAHINGKK